MRLKSRKIVAYHTKMEDLRKAIIADCEQTLLDPKNRFVARLERDSCKCFHNLKTALRVLKTDRSATERYFNNIEAYVLAKECKHTWCKDRMNEAIWTVLEERS